jgi:hypothetical protein
MLENETPENQSDYIEVDGDFLDDQKDFFDDDLHELDINRVLQDDYTQDI